MSNTKRIKVLNYRNANGISPNPANIDYGEIAIGYKKDNEAIYIKNTANDIVDFTPISIVNITYNELKNLRDNSKLKPSQYYRITNFVTTVANDPEAQSAGHRFDIIVMASEKNKLQEECYAIQHEGDTYFANCNLAAWKIWYCLDNDNTKYAWADTAQGKGVIYRMIDEWQNDCPYDFKNVQFKRYWANGINITKNEGEPKNIILRGYYGTASNTGIFTEGIDTNDSLFCFTFTRLNNIVEDYEKGSVMQSNVLDESIQTEGFDTDAGDDKLNNPQAYTFHYRCRNNILKSTEVGLSVDTKEYMALVLLNNVFITVKVVVDDVSSYQPPFDNTLGVSCYSNTFGNNCGSNTFWVRCNNNSFGNNCNNNSFGNDCSSNTFGIECVNNTFGNECGSNTFGDNCSNNTFGDNCDGNTLGGLCDLITFGYGCGSNSFVDRCGSISFGDRCEYNTFGDNCESNSFGNFCVGNSFGNHCNDNKFGNKCRNSKFGNYCDSNTFGNNCGWNPFGNYFQYNALGNNIRYIEIPTEKIYHTQALNGTKGTKTNKLTLEFAPETTYSQFAGTAPDGTLMVWVPTSNTIEPVQGNKQYNDY